MFVAIVPTGHYTHGSLNSFVNVLMASTNVALPQVNSVLYYQPANVLHLQLGLQVLCQSMCQQVN